MKRLSHTNITNCRASVAGELLRMISDTKRGADPQRFDLLPSYKNAEQPPIAQVFKSATEIIPFITEEHTS